jgi:hypothetical protein
MDVYGFDGPSVNTFACNKHDGQMWIWNATDGTVRSEHNGQCLTVPLELEIWAGQLLGGSQAVI